MSERPKERDWKSRTRRKACRGFKSRPLRTCARSESAGADSDRATYLDFNRAGVPLIEIVTEPDLRSAADAADVGGVFLSNPGNPAGQQIGGVGFSGPNNYNGFGVFSGTR